MPHPDTKNPDLELLERCSRLPTTDQMSLAIALIDYAREKLDPASPSAESLAGAKADLTEALGLIDTGQ